MFRRILNYLSILAEKPIKIHRNSTAHKRQTFECLVCLWIMLENDFFNRTARGSLRQNQHSLSTVDYQEDYAIDEIENVGKARNISAISIVTISIVTMCHKKKMIYFAGDVSRFASTIHPKFCSVLIFLQLLSELHPNNIPE